MLTSVIIPAHNEAHNIQQCIAAARRDYVASQVEVIVVDGASTDGTPDLVPRDVTLLRAPRGRAKAMNRGAHASQGQILVFCHGDSQLPAGWCSAVIEALNQPGVSGGAFQSRFEPQVGLLRLGNYLRLPAFWPFVLGDQAQFTSRATYERVGGFPDIPLMEDLEMARALHRAGKLVRIPLRVTTSSRRAPGSGVLRQLLLDLWLEFRCVCLGASAEELARHYVSSREKAARNDVLTMRDRPYDS